MRLILSILTLLQGLLLAGELEVHCYRISEKNLWEAYRIFPLDENQYPFDGREELVMPADKKWLGPVVDQAGFESRFLTPEMTLRDCSELVKVISELKKFEGKAVYSAADKVLIMSADEKMHGSLRSILGGMIPKQIQTEVSIFRIPDVTAKGRSGLWETIPDQTELLMRVSGKALPGQPCQVQTESGDLTLEIESFADHDGAFVESRFTVKVNLPEDGFSWRTGINLPVGLMWAQEVASGSGESSVVMAVKHELLSLEGDLIDQWILKEEGVPFLREERLREIRWKDPSLKPKWDMTKSFHVFDAPFDNIYIYLGAVIELPTFQDGKYPELSHIEGHYYDFRELLERNGVAFRAGDFAVCGERDSKILAKLDEVNLDLLAQIIEASKEDRTSRMIQIELVEVKGDDFRKGKLTKKMGLMVWPGQVGTVTLGEELELELEAQIDSAGDLVEMRATLSEIQEEETQKHLFKTGLSVESGKPIAVYETTTEGVKSSWVLTARVLDFEKEVDRFLKAREEKK